MILAGAAGAREVADRRAAIAAAKAGGAVSIKRFARYQLGE